MDFLYNVMYTTSSRAPKRKFRVHMTIKMPKCATSQNITQISLIVKCHKHHIKIQLCMYSYTYVLPVSSSKISLPIEQPLLQASGWGDCVCGGGGGDGRAQGYS